MSVPMDHNQQNNYDEYMAEKQDPSNHPIDNIPSPQEDHWGTSLPTGTQPSKSSTDGGGRGDTKPNVGAKALSELKDLIAKAGQNTSKTSGGKKKR